jgi:type IV secretory pathway VirB2 component (pilin)
MAVGFAGLVAWQVLTAAVGYRDRDGWPKRVMRAGALCRALVWGYLAVTATELAIGGGSAAGGSPGSTTASVMSWPAGSWIVALVGAVVAGTGLGQAIFGWRDDYLEQFDPRARSRDGRRRLIVVLGRVGYLSKGDALLVVGLLLGWAAWTHDPHKSGGLDNALHEILGGVLGKVAIMVVALGLACFGLFLVARAWHLNRESLTS